MINWEMDLVVACASWLLAIWLGPPAGEWGLELGAWDTASWRIGIWVKKKDASHHWKRPLFA